MNPRRKLELSIYQIFSKLVAKTIETIWMKKKDFQQAYRVVGTETYDIILTVREVTTTVKQESKEIISCLGDGYNNDNSCCRGCNYVSECGTERHKLIQRHNLEPK